MRLASYVGNGIKFRVFCHFVTTCRSTDSSCPSTIAPELSCCWYVDTVSECIFAPNPGWQKWKTKRKQKEKRCRSFCCSLVGDRGRRETSGQDHGKQQNLFGVPNFYCCLFLFNRLLSWPIKQTCWHLPGVLIERNSRRGVLSWTSLKHCGLNKTGPLRISNVGAGRDLQELWRHIKNVQHV